MILCFYRQKVETFKEKHKIIDVSDSSFDITDIFFIYCSLEENMLHK